MFIFDQPMLKKHYQAVKDQYKRAPKVFPTLTISDDLQDIDNITEEMFSIKNYESYSPMKAYRS